MDIKCYTCFNENCVITECFKGCSYRQCSVCILEWLKIKSNEPVYECPQCKQVSTYTYIGSNENVKFSEWCRNYPSIVDKLFQKIKNANINQSQEISHLDYDFDNIFESGRQLNPELNGRFMSELNNRFNSAEVPRLDTLNLGILDNIGHINGQLASWSSTSLNNTINYYDPDIITQQELNSDLENIRRHLPTLYYQLRPG